MVTKSIEWTRVIVALSMAAIPFIILILSHIIEKKYDQDDKPQNKKKKRK